MSWLASTLQGQPLRDTLPGQAGLPVIGHSLDFLYRPVELALRWEDRFGPVFWLSAFGQTMVALIGPEVNQQVLRNSEQAFSNHQGWDFFIGRFFTRGLMLLDFDEHRLHRGIMQSAFKKPVLVEYQQRMNPLIARELDGWHGQRDFRVLTRMKQLTLNIATEVFMGEQLGPAADAINRDFVDCVQAGTALLRFPVPGGRHWRGLRARHRLECFFASRISARRARPGSDLFSQLCQAEDEQGRRFSDEDVINHMIFMLMAAHDTTTLTLTAVMYYLGKHPDWQQRVRAECQALQRPALCHEDLATLELTDRVIKESLRLFSPVHGIPRRTVKDVEVAGQRIPAGTRVMISPYVTHRLQRWWSDPERFDPDRFTPERAEHKRDPYQYIPFGGGAHMCIGLHFADLQIKSILHQLLLRYRWSLPERYEMPVNFTSLPSPSDGLPLRLMPLTH